VYEKAEKFAVGEFGSKSKKFVEAAKGTNLFFAIYESISEDGNRVRSFVSVPLRMVVDCQKADIKHWKQQLDHVLHSKDMVPSTAQIIALLSPGDLVYVPTKEEIATQNYSYAKDRIYKMVSSSGNQVFFILNVVASPILNKEEYSALNKMERAITGEMIKEICVPIKVDRLGNIL
jgi:CRISPR-associated endonuclease Csn1